MVFVTEHFAAGIRYCTYCCGYSLLNILLTECFVRLKVYTDIGSIYQLYHVCPPVRKIIHSLKLVDYIHVQADRTAHGITTYLSMFVHATFKKQHRINIDATSSTSTRRCFDVICLLGSTDKF